MRVALPSGVRLFCEVDGLQLRPDGDRLRRVPTLVLLHGGPGFDHSAFKAHFGPLAAHCRVVLYDHRGMGRSDRSGPAEWNLARWSDDLGELLDVLGLERPIVLGQSFGGFVAMRFASDRPDRVAGLVLSSTAARHVEADCLAAFEALGGPAVRAAAARFFADPGEATFGPFLETCMPTYNTTPQPPGPRRRQILTPEVLFHFWRGEHHDYDLRPTLARITGPVAVVNGGRDPITPPVRSQEIVAALTAAEVEHHHFPEAGHGVYRDDPAFLDRVLPDIVARFGA